MLSVRSLDGFEENILVTVTELEFVCQTSTVFFFFFQKSACAFFSLTDRCQIVTDTWKKLYFKVCLEAL